LAIDRDVTIAIPTAAATVTFVPSPPPSPLFAGGVFVLVVLPLESFAFADVEVLVGLAVDVLARAVRRALSPLCFSSAPAELACASVLFVDERRR
jgi:hypothetical protein